MCVFLGCVCVEGRQGLSSSKPLGVGMVDKDIQEADCLGDCLSAGAQEVRGPDGLCLHSMHPPAV